MNLWKKKTALGLKEIQTESWPIWTIHFFLIEYRINKVQTCHIRWQKCFYCSFFQGLASIFGGQEIGGHSTQLIFKCWVIPFFYLNQKNFKRYCEKLEKQRKNKTSTLYCAGKSSLHGAEIWIFPGFEVTSNFSALKTLLPNKQYLGKK